MASTPVTPQPLPGTPAAGAVPVAPAVSYPAAPVGAVHPHEHEPSAATHLRELVIYSHSTFFYWWPIWVAGYALAAATWFQGEYVSIGGREMLFHPSKNLGVLFTVAFLVVILFTNMTLRGKTSIIAILLVMFLTVFFAYMGWWETILSMLPHLAIYMNLGFYLTFSTAVFIPWLAVVFIYDRMDYWRVRPGQLTFEHVIGAGASSFDTRGMVFEKAGQDVFRHWLLGFGSGDIRIVPSGSREDLRMPNVLFVDRKVRQIQELIAIKPDSLAD